MIVMKFGGTSVASSKNISLVGDIVKNKKSDSIVVVVSAFGGITNKLIEAGNLAKAGKENYHQTFHQIEERHISAIKELIPLKLQSETLSKTKLLLNELEDILRGTYLVHELTPKTMDRILSFGELLSANIVNDYFHSLEMDSHLVDPRNFIFTDIQFGNANVDFENSNEAIRKNFKSNKLYVCPGFVASSNGETTTLGRGGSDYTSAIIASALNADKLEIWTDVSGMMTADPRLVKSAFAIPEISYEEAMELSHFGAKVIYPPTIQPVLENSIPIHIKNTFESEAYGTLISNSSNGEDKIVKGISSVRNIALINLSGSGMIGIPNYSYRFFKALSSAKINVILITQASSEHSICVAINQTDVQVAQEAISQEFEFELLKHRIDNPVFESELAIVSLVGNNMKAQVGVSGQLFNTLAQNGINIKAIAQGSSEKNISVVVQEKEVKKST